MHLPRGLLLFVYALYRQDVVFIAGQAFGLFVHLRNLCSLVRRGPRFTASGDRRGSLDL